jgi:hypothetical protein
MFPAESLFISVTTNVYDVPLDKPETLIGELEEVPVIPLGVDVATYSVASGFPKYDGAEKVIDAFALPAVADPIIGVPGLRPPEEDVTPLFFALIFSSLSLVLPSYEHYILLFKIFYFFCHLFIRHVANGIFANLFVSLCQLKSTSYYVYSAKKINN